MNIDLQDFSEPQRRALLDLLVLATYLDRHLGADEDARVRRLLTAMGWDNPYDRRRLVHEATNRVRRHAEDPELARKHSVKLARLFLTQAQCRQVCELLEELVACDGDVTPEERRFIQELRDVFQV